MSIPIADVLMLMALHSLVMCNIVQADQNLGKFLDYCTYGHMIDNVILIVTGTLHERDVQVGTCTRDLQGAELGSGPHNHCALGDFPAG